nr:30S ribosomal protein S6 [Clostridia bacterium]
MEKKICSYETLFAISGNYSEEDYKTLCEKFVNLVNDNATDVTVNEWGKKKLAYPINYITEGYYVLLTFKSEPTFPLELERVFGITEGVIRYMTLAVEEKAAPEAPAAVVEAVEEATEQTTEVVEATEE